MLAVGAGRFSLLFYWSLLSGKDSPTHATSNSRSPSPRGWSGDAMVPGKLPVPGCPTI